MARRTKAAEVETTETVALTSEGPADTNGHAPQAETSDGRPSWTSREGNSEKKVDKTRAITDVETGMRFQFNHVTHEAELLFEQKPSAEIRGFLKDNGFQFDTDQKTGEKVWHTKISFDTREQDRVAAKRTFWKAVDMVREEKGLPARSQSSEMIPD